MDTQAIGGPLDELRREEAGLLACVHCGFCLNACPTYTRLGHEGDSPRGRLDLMRAVMEGRLEPDDEAFRTHIDRCLGCRACEPVCPSGVPYGFLLERARFAIAESAGIAPSTRLLIAAYTGPFRSIVTLASRALRDTGLARILARAAPRRLASMRFGLAMLASSSATPRLLRRSARPPAAAHTQAYGGVRGEVEPRGGVAEDVAPDGERAFAEPHGRAGGYPEATAATPAKAEATQVPHATQAGQATQATAPAPATGGVPATIDVTAGAERPAPAPPDATRASPTRIRVGMLTGCVQESLFSRVNRATVRVLEANGCEVVAVPSQVCCGALDAHAGRLERMRKLARANIAAFERAGVERVVVNAAGCGAMLKEYGEQLRHDEEWFERAKAFVAKVRDLSEFLAERPLRRGAPVQLRVTYDAPCHLHHAQRIRESPLRVLDSVPGLERVPLRDADECCGGAGLYGVHHPELGGRVLGDKVAAIRDSGAEVVLTPNPGCMMQIGAGLILEGVDAVVMHPVEVLDESYRRAGEGQG